MESNPQRSAESMVGGEEGSDIITLVNGFPQGPNGLIVPNGSIVFQLNIDATVVAEPGGFVCADIPIVFQFNDDGEIQQTLANGSSAPAQIYSNEELYPQNDIGLGTYYLVTFYDQNGARLNRAPMWWQFPESANSTVDISQMEPVSTVGGNVIFYPTSVAGGTVTSVTFTGDGTVLSATPSFPVTTTGTLTATLLEQSANTILAGPTSGGMALPTFRGLVIADLPTGYNLWSNLGNAAASLLLANTTYATTFTQTTAVNWTWKNITASTSYTAQQDSPALIVAGTYWTGSVSAQDAWTIQAILGTNTPTDNTSFSVLSFTHSGATVAQCLFAPGYDLAGVYYPGIGFTTDVTSGLYDYGSSQMAIVAGGIPVAIVGTSGSGVISIVANGTIGGAGAIGFITFPSDPGSQGCVNFNPPVGYPGASMYSIGLTQLATDPTTGSWGASQAGRMWYNTTGNVVKFWNGSAVKTVATV